MAKSGADKMAEEEMEIMKGHISALFTGRVPFKPPVTFPQSHIIYADSIHHAHEIIEKGGYTLLCLVYIYCVAQTCAGRSSGFH